VSSQNLSYQEAKNSLIQAWGTLGSSWGINKTMAQIHALLLISPEALSTEQIMQDLQISRGNANMNTRALIDWGLVHKIHKPGDRKEYFASEKDMWQATRKIAQERRKRELSPVIKVLDEVQHVENPVSPESKELVRVTKELHYLVTKADSFLSMITKFDQSRFLNFLLRLKK
jgi:DNA-binding transcriptional regulator GbsR (MarR family)